MPRTRCCFDLPGSAKVFSNTKELRSSFNDRQVVDSDVNCPFSADGNEQSMCFTPRRAVNAARDGQEDAAVPPFAVCMFELRFLGK